MSGAVEWGQDRAEGELATPEVGGPLEVGVGAGAALDRSRVRTLVGLCLLRLGPRASSAVMGTFLTLLASTRTASAVAITFATTADRAVAWLAYPLLGRASDQSRTVFGRRAPYLAGALAVSAAAIWALPLTRGYWSLVGLVFVARGAMLAYKVANAAVIPEAFGRSRWIRALVVTFVLGSLAGLSIRATVITRWQASDPATWGVTFRLAAVYMAIAALAALVLVREAPAARQPRRPSGRLRSQARSVMAVPNAKALVATIGLGAAAFGAVGRLTPVFYAKVLHAGGSTQAGAAMVTAALALVLGGGAGVVLARRLRRRTIMVAAPVLGALLAGAQMAVHTFVQSLALVVLGAPLAVLWVMASALFVLQLAPRQGGMGERYGMVIGPVSLASMLASYAAAGAVDAAGTYRVMWLFPAVLLLGAGLAMAGVRIPPGYERLDLGRVLEPLARGARRQLQGGGRRLVAGELSDDDVDAAAVFDLARRVLGDPYHPARSTAGPADGQGAGADPG